MEPVPNPGIKRKVSKRGRPEGRPSKCAAPVIEAVCRAYAQGLSLEDACRASGLARDAAAEWQKSRPEFSEALKKARAQRQLFLLEQLEHGGAAWTRWAWLLERLCPGTYRLPSVQATQTVQVGSPEFRISVERAEDLTRRSAALESEAESLLNGRPGAAGDGDGTGRNRLQGLR